jgi:hypothetical protein
VVVDVHTAWPLPREISRRLIGQVNTNSPENANVSDAAAYRRRPKQRGDGLEPLRCE